MIRVEIRETIERPVQDVFDQLVEIDKYPSWLPKKGLFITCTQDSDGAVGTGTRYTDKTRLGPVRGEIVSFEKPKKVVFRYAVRWGGRTVMEGWPGYALEADGERGTRLHHVAEGHLHGFFKLLQPIIQRVAQAERQRTVRALKRSLEAP